MSLDYNLSKCVNIPAPSERSDAEEERTVCLIHRTMMIGMGSITEANAGEVYVRNMMFTKLYGGLEFTAAEIKLHIGMWTNADTLTRTQWVKRITEDRAQEYLYQWRLLDAAANRPELYA